jgi:peptide/nickel transport system substrate-binding protein
MRRLRAGLLLLAALALVTAACEGAGDEGPEDGQEQVDTTFTYSVNSEVMTDWDPATDYSNEVIAMHNMYETLTRYDANTQEIEPGLATEWSSSNDGLSWTFTLREGVTFHTGRAMDSTAVKEAIERTMELGQAASYIWAAVKSIETPDPQTVGFELSYASPLDLVASGTYSAFIYDVEAAGDADLNEWFQEGNDAGTGPYTVESYEPGDEFELRLAAYQDYWGGWDGAHYERLEFRVTPEATTAAQLLESGQVDLVQRMSPQLWDTFEGRSGFQTTSAASWQTLFAMLNTADGPLANENVRLAVAHAIDYDGMIAALQGAAEPLTGYVPPGLWGHSDQLERYPYDPDESQALLEQEGFGSGGEAISLELTYLKGDADEELVATLMKSNLAELNVELNVRGLQWQAQWDKAKSDNVAERQDILIFYWWPDYPDPVSWFYNLFRTEKEPFFNLAYYSNPQVDQQIDEASVVSATDRDEAAQMYEEMQATLLDDAPAIPLYTQVYQRAMLDSVEGFEDNPAYPSVVFAYELTPTG